MPSATWRCSWPGCWGRAGHRHRGLPAKLDFVRGLGVDAAVHYGADDWPDRVRKAAPDGADVAADAGGGQIPARTVELLAPLGRLVVYGAAGGEPGQLSARAVFGMRTTAGFALMAWRAARPDQARQDIDQLAAHFAAGRLHTAVHATLPPDEVAEAHRILDERANLGRILLVP